MLVVLQLPLILKLAALISTEQVGSYPHGKQAGQYKQQLTQKRKRQADRSHSNKPSTTALLEGEGRVVQSPAFDN